MREEIAISKRLRLLEMLNTDTEYMVVLRYILNKNIVFKGHCESEMGWGLA